MLKKGNRVYLLRWNIKTTQLSDKLNYKKLGPYKITKVIPLVNYELLLLCSIGKIHLIFHISLLKLASLGAPLALVIIAEPLNPEKEYIIEKILDYKVVRGVEKYLIKWEDYLDLEAL